VLLLLLLVLLVLLTLLPATNPSTTARAGLASSLLPLLLDDAFQGHVKVGRHL